MEQRPNGDLSPHLRRPQANFMIDLVTGIVFSAMIGTGLLMKYILPPGSRGGSGLVWLGQARHFWGDIHFWLAVTFLALVVVHVWLHWSWVKTCWPRFLGSLRSPLTIAVLCVMILLLALPLLVPRDRLELSPGETRDHEEGRGQIEQGPKGKGPR